MGTSSCFHVTQVEEIKRIVGEGLYELDIVGPNGSPVSGGGAVRRRVYPGQTLADWTAANGTLSLTSGTAGAAAALDASTLIFGKPALKCTLGNAAADTFVAQYVLASPISVAGIKTLHVPILVTTSDSTHIQNITQIWLQTSSGKNLRCALNLTGMPPGMGAVEVFNRDSTEAAGGSGATDWTFLDTELVTTLKIVAVSASATAGSYPIWFGQPVADARATQSAVSIRFDGEYLEQYTNALPILQKYNLTATLALVHSNIGQANFMSAAQITAMCAAGCDVAHHTFDGTKTNGYADSGQWANAAAIAADVSKGLRNIVANGWPLTSAGVIVEGYTGGYFGLVTGVARQNAVLSGLVQGGMQAFCTLDSNKAAQNTMGQSDFGRGVQKARASQTLSASGSQANYLAAIDRAARDGTWLQILAHQVVSDSATPTGNQITVSNFDAICARIAQYVSAGQMRCVTLGDGFARSWA